MYQSKKILCIIPARSGSKGIPNKNIIKVNDKPLISFVVESAKKSKYIDNVIVDTDSGLIANISKSFGASTPFLRPSKFAQDTSTSISAIHHCITKLNSQKEVYDTVIVLQPTQPLIQSFHIDESLDLYFNRKESVLGISLTSEKLFLMRTINSNNMLTNLLNQKSSTVRRQDAEKTYIVNGMLYINPFSEILNNMSLSLNDNKLGYLISTNYYVDIDTPFDLEVFKLKLKLLQNESS